MQFNIENEFILYREIWDERRMTTEKKIGEILQ